MTDIDIERLKKIAAEEFRFDQHHKDCIYENPYCAVLALIERLEKAEAQRDRLTEPAECLLDSVEYGGFLLNYVVDITRKALQRNKTDE